MLFTNYKKQLLLSILFLCFFKNFSQESVNDSIPNKKHFLENVSFGGGLGMGFGNGFFNVSLSPTAIYNFNSKIGIGLGYNLAINKRKKVANSVINGGSVIGLFNIIPQLQASTEFAQNHVYASIKNKTSFTETKYWVPSLLLGLGYNTSNIIFGFRYDALYNEKKSIYASPITPFIRILL